MSEARLRISVSLFVFPIFKIIWMIIGWQDTLIVSLMQIQLLLTVLYWILAWAYPWQYYEAKVALRFKDKDIFKLNLASFMSVLIIAFLIVFT